jgi:CHAT domain-containing protein
VASVGLIASCNSYKKRPEELFQESHQAFIEGNLQQSRDQAQKAYERFRNSDFQWAWKFRLLDARVALWQGRFEDVIKLLESQSPPDAVSGIPRLAILGVAYVHTRNYPEAARALTTATEMCTAHTTVDCGEVLQSRGLLASEQNDSVQAEKFYNLSLTFARSHHDTFLESNSLLNLGAESLAQDRFDEALDRSEAAYAAARKVNARIVELVAQGNIGWACYRLGDWERALELHRNALHSAIELGDVFDQTNQLTNIGYIYMDRLQLDSAARSFQQALGLAEQIGAKQYTYNALRVLARLAIQNNNLDQAAEYSKRALNIARESGNHLDEFFPLLAQGQIAARRGNFSVAQQTFQSIERDKLCPVFLRWEVQHALAQLYEGVKKQEIAGIQYRDAVATFESARAEVRHEDFHLSFLTNGWRIYDDYIHFLVARGNTNDALRWADYSRARTLSEGLGYLKKGAAGGPPALNASSIAQQTNGTVLYYWLGEKQSYLWAITPRQIKLFTLPAADQIDAAVQRYRAALAGPQDVLSYSDTDGRWLYDTLIGPAQSLLHKDGTVFLVADGSLNNLNFETLLVEGSSRESSSQLSAVSSQVRGSAPAGTKLHYWIEDATVSNASSLLTLGASRSSGHKSSRRLLMLGNGIPAGARFPALPHAASQMDAVAGHFPARQIFSRESATPAAYLESHPEQFTHIHFVAHGTASRLSPLDSAIILSPSGANQDAFKLYGREIIHHPLHAELVTVSSCNGSGDRAYKGEGLVGLSWAFLRAGAHNVVAALWEVEDTSVEKLMRSFYEELDRGKSPAVALRSAKLSLLRSEGLSNPFYWAPFQLYTQGASARTSNTAKTKSVPLRVLSGSSL